MESKAPLKLLVVDDQEDDRSLLVKSLTNLKQSQRLPVAIDVIMSVDGSQAALDLIRNENFDCVFVDYDLKERGTTGLDVLKSAQVLEHVPGFIMVTGMGNEQVAVDAMKAGAMDYLVKPPRVEALERSLLNLLERRELEALIREQETKLIQAERQRVMFESIGTTCHHFSQPVTALLGRLELLLEMEKDMSPRQRSILEECLSCTRKMVDLLNRFQKIREYRTIPYSQKVSILDIEQDEFFLTNHTSE